MYFTHNLGRALRGRPISAPCRVNWGSSMKAGEFTAKVGHSCDYQDGADCRLGAQPGQLSRTSASFHASLCMGWLGLPKCGG